MDFATAIRTVFSKYATFSGRAVRSEFWWWALFCAIASGVTSAIDYLLGFGGAAHGSAGPVSAIWSLGVLLPSLAVSVRRLHDIGRSGWWYLIILIPLIGLIILIYWAIKPSEPGTNRFG